MSVESSLSVPRLLQMSLRPHRECSVQRALGAESGTSWLCGWVLGRSLGETGRAGGEAERVGEERPEPSTQVSRFLASIPRAHSQ